VTTTAGSSKAPRAKPIVGTIGGTPEQQAFLDDVASEFEIDKDRLIKIRDHYLTEMQKGLDYEDQTLAMIPSYVEGRLTGQEKGNYLALDLGGTNLRVVLVCLEGDGKFKTTSTKSRLTDELKTGSMRNLCGKLRKHACIYIHP
jgi:hexokinase